LNTTLGNITLVHLSPSSIIWHKPMSSEALQLGK